MKVEVEETVRRYRPANNGGTPLWCFHSALLARYEGDVITSIRETGAKVTPEDAESRILCNTRWQLWRRTSGGWRIEQSGLRYNERDPCPLGLFRDGRIILSINPHPEEYGGAGNCKPHILQFSLKDLSAAPVALMPAWRGGNFTEHSYRGMGIDAEGGELLLLNISGYEGYYPSFCDSAGKWHALDVLRFPIRACYPEVVLRNRAAHILAIGDIEEPVSQWRQLKREKLGGKWDFVFRRLFYVYSPDVTKEPFSEPIEVATAEETAGLIRNLDLMLDSSGKVHVLYLKRSHQYAFIRDEFFPSQAMTCDLVHLVLDGDGKVVARHTLVRASDGSDRSGSEWRPRYGRLHDTGDGRLFAIWYASRNDEGDNEEQANFLMEIRDDGSGKEPLRIGLKNPFRELFFTNTTRGGSKPSPIIDLFGEAGEKYELRYARLRIE